MKTDDNVYRDIEEMEKTIEHVTPSLNNHKNARDLWKYACAILFSICMILECVNVVLTSNCKNIKYSNEQNNSIMRDMINELGPRMLPSTSSVLSENISTPNTTLCSEMRQFPLPNSDKIISVCTFEGKVRMDIRQYINNKPTIKGIYFTFSEYVGVTHIIHYVRGEMLRQSRLLRTRV